MTETAAPQDLQELTASFVEQQAAASERLGSHLYAELMRRTAEDVRAGGPAWEVLRPHANADRGSALTLRLLGAVHRLVLQDRAPQLAALYPSAGGSGQVAGAWPAFRDVLEEHRDELVELVGWSCQTNEVGRAAGLLGGFLTVARETGLPLRLLELGASAGLQLRWDHFRYEWDERASTHRWGPPDSPVRLSGHWDVPSELLAASVEVAERSGCDRDPVDVDSEEGRLRLRQSVWADQPVRLERLNGAIELARRVPARLDGAGAGAWLAARLAEPVDGVATVVYHSVVWQYLSEDEREAVRTALRGAAARATPRAPVAWLRSEPENILRSMRVRLTLWPAGEERLLAKAGAHGFPVRWQR
jgi:hypothetical protein